jgi:hypothetical protein
MSEIDAARPISIGIQWVESTSGHNPAIDGYDGSYSSPTIDIQDPIFGHSIQDFNSFPGSYNGGATWTDSFLTK